VSLYIYLPSAILRSSWSVSKHLLYYLVCICLYVHVPSMTSFSVYAVFIALLHIIHPYHKPIVFPFVCTCYDLYHNLSLSTCMPLPCPCSHGVVKEYVPMSPRAVMRYICPKPLAVICTVDSIKEQSNV
jgi:hypothetical protein